MASPWAEEVAARAASQLQPAGRIEPTPGWRSPARLPSPRRVPAGQVVQLDPAYQAVVAGLLEALAPSLAKALDAHLVPVARRAAAAWPVKSGLSAALLALEYTEEGGAFVATLRNRAFYAALITQKGSKRRVVRDLIWDPGQEAAELVSRDWARHVAEGE